jgi:hypothetical protein
VTAAAAAAAAAANGYQQRLAAAHNARTIRAHAGELSGLRQWADTMLRQHYCGYELRDCWPSHIHAIWEFSTLTATWPVLCLRRRVGMQISRNLNRWVQTPPG